MKRAAGGHTHLREFTLVMAHDWRGNVRELESQLLRAALEEAKGNKAEAARILGIQRRLLYEKMAEFGLS